MRVVVINKIDRPEARAKEALRLVQGLFWELANDVDQLGFPVLYTSAQQGYVPTDPDRPGTDMQLLFDAIVYAAPPVAGDRDAPLRILAAALGYEN